MDYDADLQTELTRNRTLWKMLQDNGVTDKSRLCLDFFFYARTRKSAEALAALLLKRYGYKATVEAKGWLFWRRWAIMGTTERMAVSQDALDQWVTRMVNAARETEADFDGWGTEADDTGGETQSP